MFDDPYVTNCVAAKCALCASVRSTLVNPLKLQLLCIESSVNLFDGSYIFVSDCSLKPCQLGQKTHGDIPDQ